MLHFFGLLLSCLLLVEWEGNKTRIVCSFIVHFARLAFVKIFIGSAGDLCETIGSELCLHILGPLERELPKIWRKENHRKAQKETLHAYLWLLALYLLKANNKLSLFMPFHAHSNIIFGRKYTRILRLNLKPGNKLISRHI